jgi:uncharacterized protein (TIGR02996 family)
VQPLLAAVIAQPNEDAPRLIYADWLEEHGQPARAEFIRVQIACAQLPADHPQVGELEHRSQLLLERHQDEWAEPVRAWATGFKFQRGFIGKIIIEAKRFLDLTPEMLAQAPIRHVDLLDVAGCLPRIGLCPLLARVEQLKIYASRVGDPLARTLAGCEHLRQLTSLELQRNCITDAGVEALATTPHLSQLRSLDLHENQITEMGARALMASATLGAVEQLDLGANQLGTAGIETLWTNPGLPALAELNVSKNRVQGLGSFMAAARMLGRLRLLDLSHNPGFGAVVRQLVTCPHLAGLAELRLSHCELNDAGAFAIAAAPQLAALRALDLSHNALTAEGARFLADSHNLAQLRSLKVAKNPLGEMGMRALIASRYLRRLYHLHGTGQPLDAAELARRRGG